jgi:iron complex outermembrane receptor protein
MPVGRLLNVGMEFQYYGAMSTLSGDRADGFLLGNLSVATQMRHAFQLSAGLYNVFNTRYGYPGAEDHLQNSIHQDGRTFRLKVMRTF